MFCSRAAAGSASYVGEIRHCTSYMNMNIAAQASTATTFIAFITLILGFLHWTAGMLVDLTAANVRAVPHCQYRPRSP